MIPLFKSCSSIGRSILTLDKRSKEDGPDSIIEICKENKLKTLFLVEDSMTGFMKAFNMCQAAGINLVFGIMMTCCNSVKEEGNKSDHKIILFAKNDEGCKWLNRAVSYSFDNNEKIDFEYLRDNWSEDDVELAIPFYDSFIFNNNMNMSNCIPSFGKIKPTFFIERNNLPFDSMVENLVEAFCEGKYKTQLTKSIYYKEKKDFEALQAYKILCTRTFGRQRTLSCPNLDHFASDEFCFESYLEYER